MFNLKNSMIERYYEKYIYINGGEYLDFSNTNFLGLRDDVRVKDEIKRGVDLFSLNPEINKTLNQNVSIYHSLADKIKKMSGLPEAIVYSTGYNVNVGLIASLFNQHDVIFSDSLNSINILEGIYLSNAKLVRYKHNDIKDLDERISKYESQYEKIAVITDSVFTMDGEKAKLKEIAKLKEKHNFFLIVDESNANGLIGENFGGVSEEQKVTNKVDMIFGYLYKVFGSTGEYASMTSELKELLTHNSLRRDLINKSVISPIMAIGTLKSIELAETELWRSHKVIDLGAILHKELKNLNFSLTESETGIITIIFDSDKEVIDISKLLFEEKILVAVTIGKTTIKPRIRLFLNAHIDKKDIEFVIEKFKFLKETYYSDKNKQ